jgi:CRISPR-associated protein Cas2
MTAKRSRYVVSYDIPCDKRRVRVAKALTGYGERVQYSVFECLLTEAQFERLWEELQRKIDADEDSLRAYRLCPPCAEWTRTVGRAVSVEVPEVYIA